MKMLIKHSIRTLIGQYFMLSFIKKIFIKNGASNSAPIIIPASEHAISRSFISRNCLVVLDTLANAGFEVYLVGGSVRDLLLGREPKDFDVATNAKPEEIYNLFRNCRLIGKRFRLAHIYFRHEIIEVATFRKLGKKDHHHQSKGPNGLLKRDNVYGTLKDDVWRRDFTLNALYYDAKSNSIIDHTNGLLDLQQGIIRIIGDAETRYKEDPVRILRAIRFHAKLGMPLEENTAKAIPKTHMLLAAIAPARLLDETHKLFNSGNAVATFAALRHYDVLQHLYPLTEEALSHPTLHPAADKFILHALQNTDARVAQDKPLNPAFLVSVFLWYPLQIILEKEHNNKTGTPNHSDFTKLEHAAGRILRQAKQHLAFTQVITQTVIDIWLLQFQLIGRRQLQIYHLAQQSRFRAAYDFLCLRAKVDDSLKPIADWWTEWQEVDDAAREQMINELPKPKFSRNKKRRYPKKRSPANKPIINE
jgi:poly(A) polymerase